jgi:hypothetical protein
MKHPFGIEKVATSRYVSLKSKRLFQNNYFETAAYNGNQKQLNTPASKSER